MDSDTSSCLGQFQGLWDIRGYGPCVWREGLVRHVTCNFSGPQFPYLQNDDSIYLMVGYDDHML